MAFPTVVSTATGSGGSTSTSITIPAGSVGDLLLVFFAKDGGAAPTGITGTGWALLGGQADGDATQCWAGVYHKVADGSDSLSVEYALEVTAYAVYRISGQGAGLEIGLASNAAGTPTANPDAPSLTPSWGSADTLWVAMNAWDNASRTLTTYPTSYTSNQLDADGGGSSAGARVAVASRELAATSDDPSAATISVAEQWVAATVAIQPASGGAATATVGATTADAVGSITAGGGASAVVAVTTDNAVGAITASGGTFSGDIRLTIGMNKERGGFYASATGLRYVVFNADHTAMIASGSSLTTDASGNAVIDVNGTSYGLGDYVPVLITEYNAATAAADRVVRSCFGFVPAGAQP